MSTTNGIKVMSKVVVRVFSLVCAIALTGAVGLAPSTQAEDVVSDPTGFITLNAVGTNGISGPAYSFWGLGMTQPVTNRGVIADVSGTQLTVNNALVSDAFNQGSLGPLYFIEITSGSNAGVMEDISSNNTEAVFTSSDISSLVASGQTYKIYPHWTLSKVFGASNETGLASADKILVQNPLTQQFATYFYSTGGKAGIGWRQSGGGTADKSDLPLYLDQGVLILRSVSSGLTNKLVGDVKLGAGASSNGFTVIPIGPTNNFVANVYASSSMTLSNSNLYTGNPTTGLTSSDKVLIHDDATGQFLTYFWSTGGKAGVGWRQSGGGATERGDTPIPSGTCIVIQLAPENMGFNWNAQSPY